MLLRLDAATFNFADMTMSRLSDLLIGGGSLGFVQTSKAAIRAEKAMEDCQCNSPLGVFWFPHTGDPLHSYQVQFKGVGCNRFSSVLPVLSHDAGEYHISRLDFAQDYIMGEREWHDLLMMAEEICYQRDKDGKPFKKITPVGGGLTKTLYIGSRSSSYYFRIYNKTLEDPDYKYLDDNGNEVEIPEDYFVIRYEIELKRFRRTRRGEKIIIDPTPLFDLYYSDEYDSQQKLLAYINDLWQSYAPDFLPDGWMSEVYPYWSVTNEKFCSTSDDKEYHDLVSKVAADVFDGVHSFDRTMRYVVHKFGQYVPYILMRPDLFNICQSRCELKFGFVPPVDVFDLRSEAGWDDLNEDVPF